MKTLIEVPVQGGVSEVCFVQVDSKRRMNGVACIQEKFDLERISFHDCISHFDDTRLRCLWRFSRESETRLRLAIAQYFSRGIATAGSHDSPSWMSGTTTQIEPFDRGAVIAPAGDRTHVV